jgi:hypothetical protein
MPSVVYCPKCAAPEIAPDSSPGVVISCAGCGFMFFAREGRTSAVYRFWMRKSPESRQQILTWGALALLVVGVAVGGVLWHSSRLEGSTWVGAENLPGFAELKFEFKEKGVVIMTDALSRPSPQVQPVSASGEPLVKPQGPVKGKWQKQGEDVTIVFEDCIYSGKIAGSVMSGTASLSRGDFASWYFSVARK